MDHNRKSKLGRIILLIVSVLVLSAVCFWFFVVKQNPPSQNGQNDQQIENINVNDAPAQSSTVEHRPLENGTFTSSGNFGTVQAKGYVTISQVDEAFCEENCKTFKYVMFHITETPNQDFMKFIESLSGNSFAEKGAIGLGCVEEGIITYYNNSDQYGMKQYSLSSELSTTIPGSSPEKQISIELERLQSTGGGGAPSCYSHITNISTL